MKTKKADEKCRKKLHLEKSGWNRPEMTDFSSYSGTRAANF